MKKTDRSDSPAKLASPAFAAFLERGLKNVAMQSGTNVRVFNDVQLNGQDYIKYDGQTGYISIQPGFYRFDGWSLTTFGWDLTPAQQAAVYSAPGYAFIWNVEDQKIETLGSLQDPMFNAVSVLNTVIQVRQARTFYFGHQNGNKVAFISLQLFDPSLKMPDGSTSTNHAFAQLVIQRLADL
jgi:hypothetical protein